MSRVEGKGGIWAEVVKDSINKFGDRVTTFRLHYHRYIHSEFMTHRMVSKNASSSRAIPVHKQLETVKDSPAMPIHWGLNEPGMQSTTEGDLPIFGLTSEETGQVATVQEAWKHAAWNATQISSLMWQDGHGYHKQIVNRLAEPFTFMNVVATATDWENFFWLRVHPDAQPEIAELARCMYEAREASEPLLLHEGEWHLPYVDQFRDNTGLLHYCDYDGEELYTLEEAQKISASCCAQASYRKLDQSLEKAISLFDRLAGGEPLHASPFEHPCTPYADEEYRIRQETKSIMKMGLMKVYTDEDLIEKMADIVMYCGNFRGFTQYRKTMKNENMTKKFVAGGVTTPFIVSILNILAER